MVELQNKRVLVTGAGGFVGNHLCQSLHAHGADVIGMVRNSTADQNDFIERYVVDISDKQKVRELVRDVQPEFVVHLAAVKTRSLVLTEYRIGYETNLVGSLNLIEACQELPTLSRFVFLGSCEEYGQQTVPFVESSRESPVSAYGVTKLAVTQFLQALVRASDFPAVILRPSVVYGPGQGSDMFLPALIKALILGDQFNMSRGEQTRDFLYIDDLVNAILLSLNAPEAQGRVINVSSASPIRIVELAKNIARLVGGKSERLLDIGARDYRPGEAMSYWANNLLARDLMGWSPSVSLDEGLRQTINSLRRLTATR